jgi:hypothetical protein
MIMFKLMILESVCYLHEGSYDIYEAVGAETFLQQLLGRNARGARSDERLT